MKIICQSCKKEVEVTFIDFGGGIVAICPKCGKLAFSKRARRQ
jgi:predicted RNA-binding Zn-ribbon protein involved in translation (DUF1610 family)